MRSDDIDGVYKPGVAPCPAGVVTGNPGVVICRHPRGTRRAMRDLFFMPGDLGLMRHDPGLVQHQHRLGPLERGQRLQVLLTPKEMALLLLPVLGMDEVMAVSLVTGVYGSNPR